jgi:adenosylcobinamide kinase/adenosylcobinamide-phosphate guanylyltransferase
MLLADHQNRLPPLTLVLGGARSGKSAYAESLLGAAERPIYLATGQAGDAEMIDRVHRHRERRGEGWQTVEEPVDLLGALSLHSRPNRPVLVDCLTLWLTNLLLGGAVVETEIDRLIAALPDLAGPVVFVANEVGLGIVPENALARAFRDHAGLLNQKLAACCQRVVFVAAGLPLSLKESR